MSSSLPLTLESFAHLALEVRSGSDACLVMAALDTAKRAIDHLVVIVDWPEDADGRTKVVASTILYLHAAVPSTWGYLAFAYVEPDGDDYEAAVAFQPIAPPRE